jgi:hypothetical protein
MVASAEPVYDKCDSYDKNTDNDNTPVAKSVEVESKSIVSTGAEWA